MVIDGGSWRFVEGEPEPDYQSYCAADCIDFEGRLAVDRADLRQVPLLGKMRRIRDLYLGIDQLKDLQGLELADMDQLTMTGSGVETGLRSLNGLTDRELSSLSITGAPALTTLSNVDLFRIGALSLSTTGLTTLNLGGTDTQELAVGQNDQLTSIRLPNSNMKMIQLTSNPELSALSWDAGLRLSSVLVIQNPRLSTCLIDQLAAETKPDGGQQFKNIIGNGPCP